MAVGRPEMGRPGLWSVNCWMLPIIVRIGGAGTVETPCLLPSIFAAMSWSRSLSKVLYTTDGKTLITLSDARDYAIALPEEYNSRQHWQCATSSMLDAAADPSSVAAATKQIEFALFLDMRLDVTRMER